MNKRDYYEVLGVSRSASPDELRRAHRKLVRQYHPDMNRDNPAATEKFKEVQEAYDALSDPQRRKQYDQFGHDAFAGAGYPPPGAEDFRGARPSPGSSRRWRTNPNVSVEDMDFGDAGGGAGDIFEQLFGARRGAGRAGRARAPEPQRGADVEHTVTLSFEQAALGYTLSLQINRGGQLETIELKIPAGVKDGSRVRVRGKGQGGSGAATGDLYVITRVKEHAYFRRDGLNILVDLPISMYEALLGVKLDVPTLEGKVTVTVPPGTSSGSKLRIKGRGIERRDEHGDQYVVIKVIVPKDLDEDDRKLVEKLAARHPLNARTNLSW